MSYAYLGLGCPTYISADNLPITPLTLEWFRPTLTLYKQRSNTILPQEKGAFSLHPMQALRNWHRRVLALSSRVFFQVHYMGSASGMGW